MLLKGISVMLSVLLFLVGIGGSPAYAQVPVVVVDGIVLQTDAPPVIANGRILVPMRAIFEALGAARVTWLPEVNSVSVITREGKALGVGVGSPHAVFEGERFTLDVPPRIIGGRVMVPLRFVGEMMGAFVEWLPDSQTVRITSGAGGIGGPGLPLNGNGNGNGNGKKVPIINPLPDPIAPAIATAQYLRERGINVDLVVENNAAFVIDAAMSKEDQRGERQMMVEARQSISRLLGFPEIPVVLFLPPKKAYSLGFQCEFLKGVQLGCDPLHFYGNAVQRGIFFDSTHVFNKAQISDDGSRKALRHEYVHVLQSSMGVAGPSWMMEGGAEYLAVLSMEKDFPGFDKKNEYREGQRRSLETARTLQETATSVRVGYQSDHYTTGFFALEWLLGGGNLGPLIKFWEGPPQYWWRLHPDKPVSWESWFPEAFGISIEDFYRKFEVEARPAILRGERPVWNKSGSRVALKSS